MKSKYIALGLIAVVLAGTLGVTAIARADNDKKVEVNGKAMLKTGVALGLVNKILSKPSVSINSSGRANVGGATVTSVGSSSFNANVMVGSTTLSFTVNVDGNTKLMRRSNAASSLAEFSAGDTVEFAGHLTAGSPLTVMASHVKDFSINKQNATFAGMVASIDAGAQAFVLSTQHRGDVKVMVNGNTQIKLGGATGAFANLIVGGKAEVSGLWDPNAKTVTAAKIRLPDPSVKTIFQGTLKSSAINASSTNTGSLLVGIGNTDYTINVSAATAVLNSLWLRTSLSNFRVGDTIRAYGTLSGATIDATVVRDTSISL